jgi:hypothetical protein
MSTKKLKNLTLRDIRSFLIFVGCIKDRTRGGHEVWRKPGLSRPIIIQTHVDPVPEHVVRSIIKDLGISREEFLETIRGN